jgi:hypothetical protein
MEEMIVKTPTLQVEIYHDGTKKSCFFRWPAYIPIAKKFINYSLSFLYKRLLSSLKRELKHLSKNQLIILIGAIK